MSIKGFKSQQALQQKLSGFTESQSLDQARYVTVQEMPGRRHALDVTISGLYKISASPLTVSAGNIRTIICASHGASANDMIRLSDGTTVGVLSVPDVNTIVTAVELSVSPIGDTFTIWRAITPAYNSDGSLNVSVVPSPVAYSRKSGGVTVATTVLEDLDTPANSRALPVVIHSIDGAPINITAGDLNVQLSDQGANPDVTKIGDGTNRLGINSNLEAKTHDADLLTAVGVTNAKDFATQTTLALVKLKTDNLDVALSTIATKAQLPTTIGQKAMAASTSVALASDQSAIPVTMAAVPTGGATSANQATEITSLSSIDGKLTSVATSTLQTTANTKLDTIITNTTSIATSALQTTGNTSLGNLDTNLGAKADTGATTDGGTFSLIALVKRVAANITSLAAQIPTTLGIKTAANSLSVAPASDAIFNTKPKALTGSFAELLTLTTVQTFTAPANAVGALIQASDANTANIRIKQGATATATSGIQMQAGRSESLTNGTDISVCSESGTNAISVIWSIQA